MHNSIPRCGGEVQRRVSGVNGCWRCAGSCAKSAANFSKPFAKISANPPWKWIPPNFFRFWRKYVMRCATCGPG